MAQEGSPLYFSVCRTGLYFSSIELTRRIHSTANQMHQGVWQPQPRTRSGAPCMASTNFWTPEPHARPHLRLPSLAEFLFSPATSSFSFDPHFAFVSLQFRVSFPFVLTYAHPRVSPKALTPRLVVFKAPYLSHSTSYHTIPYS
jgi:hypothetical protein